MANNIKVDLLLSQVMEADQELLAKKKKRKKRSDAHDAGGDQELSSSDEKYYMGMIAVLDDLEELPPVESLVRGSRWYVYRSGEDSPISIWPNKFYAQWSVDWTEKLRPEQAPYEIVENGKPEHRLKESL